MTDSSFPFRIREPRTPLAFPVLIEWRDQLRRHIGRNISGMGVFIDAEPPYPLGSVVRIVFTYPGTQVELTAIGEVRHQSTRSLMRFGEMVPSSGVGIAFVRFEDGVVRPSNDQMAS